MDGAVAIVEAWEASRKATRLLGREVDMHRLMPFACFIVVTVPAAMPASAETLKACELEIEYRISDPAPDLPPNLRAFSGIWLGQWKSFPFTHGADNPYCAGLIVERVDRDGTAKTIYFRGSSWNTSGGLKRPSKGPWMGKISGNVLNLPRDPKWVAREYIDFQLKSPSRLEGTFRGIQTGYFTRQ
jgi:hypothetical protein